MRFGVAQYDRAIEALRDGREQRKPDGYPCRICHDSGHQAWECGHNPLHAMAVCKAIAERADELHDKLHRLEADGTIGNSDTGPDGAMFDELHAFLHYLAGFNINMGCQQGPARVVLPDDK